MSGEKKYAVFTFFKMYGCGHCVKFKGDVTDPTTGVVNVDPNSPWERLTADKDLKNLGIEFILFEFGRKKDPQTGRTIMYSLPDAYKNKVKYAPYLEMRLPDDVVNGVPYPRGQEKTYEMIKQWCMETMQTSTFNGYKNGVNTGRNPPQNRATVRNMATQPNLPPPIQTREVIQQRQPQMPVQDKIHIAREWSEQAPENPNSRKKISKFLPANY